MTLKYASKFLLLIDTKIQGEIADVSSASPSLVISGACMHFCKLIWFIVCYGLLFIFSILTFFLWHCFFLIDKCLVFT